MSTTLHPAQPAPASGDRLLQRSRRALFATILLLVPTILGAIYLIPAWRSIAGLSGVAFALGAGVFGLAVAGLPLAVIVGLCVAAFARVESLARPRSKPVGFADRCLVGIAILLSAIPALWPASKAARAFIEGSITIRQPIEHHVSLAFDPLVFWENIGYWAIATIVLASLAGYYWHSRWRAIRREHRH